MPTQNVLNSDRSNHHANMTPPTTEGNANIPASPTLVVPNRVNLSVVHAIEAALGGRDRVSWMVENTLRPDAEVMMYLSQTRAAGFLCSIDRSTPDDLVKLVRDRQVQGRHVVLLSGRPGNQPAALTDVPGKILHFADGSKLSALPVYVGMYRNELTGGITDSAPCDRTVVQFMPELKAGPELGARVRGAWLEAAADQAADHPALNTTLPHAIIDSITRHPEAMIIDGVDDSPLSYRRLLIYALIMADKLHKRVSNRRLGIILPPGKSAAIANLACLLAGITPVNIDYTISAEDFRYRIEQTGINRFITEVRFTHKQQLFAWPAPRDLIHIDRELADVSTTSVKIRELLIRLGKTEWLTGRLQNRPGRPDDEAALLFTSGTGGIANGCPYSHRMLLSAVMQLSSRLPLSAGQRVLSAMPLYHPTGLLTGLLLPLLLGLDIVTYPDTQTPRRLCELAHNYGTALTAFTPVQTAAVLKAAKPGTFAAMRYFLTAGEKLPTDLAERAAGEHKLTLYECYAPVESALPVAISAPSPAAAPGTPYIIPAGLPGTVGTPLPGVAVRISDLNRPEQSLPPTNTGLIWIRGATVIPSYLKNRPDATTCIRGKWFCTGDVGKLSDEGLLTISGRKARFSKINDTLVPHVAAEDALYKVLGLPTDDGVRRLAIVGVPNPRGTGEILVLLSTVHKNVVPQDIITARYALLNARYPAAWAPTHIMPVSSIPTLPNGSLDYPLCYRGTCRQLGIPTD